MAITIADQILTGTAWQNAYTLSGLTVGTALIIQNKSSAPAYVQIQSAAPSASNRDGFVLNAYDSCTIGASEVGAFVFGQGPVSIQNGS
jgi:hypothetical protein